ncbi:MAG: biotin--[acetyl-CoA-carboxylase] ligase [Reichenbachiella sp.]
MHKFFAKTEYLGKKVIFLPQCHSTNEEAQSILSKNVEEGTCIITANQSQGKGQRGNSWESEPDKNITFSIILKPDFLTVINQFGLHIISSLAIYEVLFDFAGKNLKIKWPNDIYFNENKIGGILIENSIRGKNIDSSIIGIGINVNQIAFENDHATSLKEISGLKFEINDLIEKIIIALEKRYSQLKNGEYDKLKIQYLRRLYLYELPSLFKSDNQLFTGTIKGIDSDGKLIINDETADRLFDFKEVEFVRN